MELFQCKDVEGFQAVGIFVYYLFHYPQVKKGVSSPESAALPNLLWWEDHDTNGITDSDCWIEGQNTFGSSVKFMFPPVPHLGSLRHAGVMVTGFYQLFAGLWSN